MTQHDTQAAPAFDWATLQREAQEWAETFADGTDYPVVSFGQIYAFGGGPAQVWRSEDLDVPRHVAVELMQWLKDRATTELRKEGGGDAA